MPLTNQSLARHKLITKLKKKLLLKENRIFNVTSKFIYNGEYSKATISFWPTLKYYKFNDKTLLYTKDRGHHAFISHIWYFWSLLAEVTKLLEDGPGKKYYFTDSTYVERIEHFYFLVRFRLWRFARNTRYMYYSTVKTFFLKNHRSLKLPIRLFILQLMSRFQKAHIQLQTSNRSHIFSLYPGPFCTLLKRPKGERASKLVRLVMFQHLYNLLSLVKLPPIILEIVGLPRFLSDLMRTLWRSTKKDINEQIKDNLGFTSEFHRNDMKFPFIWFRSNIKFSTQKFKKRGRIKRKIRRKLQIQSNFID